MGASYSTIVTSSKASSWMADFTGKEFLNQLLIPMKAISGMANTMGKESIPGALEIITKEDINLEKRVDSVCTKMLMGHVTKETGWKARGMAKVYRWRLRVRKINVISRTGPEGISYD